MSLGPAFVKLAAARSALSIPVEGLSTRINSESEDLSLTTDSLRDVNKLYKAFVGRRDIDQLGELPDVATTPLVDSFGPPIDHNGMSIGLFDPNSYSNNFFRRSGVESLPPVGGDTVTSFGPFKPDSLRKNFVRDSGDEMTEPNDEDVETDRDVHALKNPAGPFDIGRYFGVFGRSPQDLGTLASNSPADFRVAVGNFDIERFKNNFARRSEDDQVESPLDDDSSTTEGKIQLPGRLKRFLGDFSAGIFDIDKLSHRFPRSPIIEPLDLETLNKLLNVAPAASFKPEKYLSGFPRRAERQEAADLKRIVNQDEEGPGLGGPLDILHFYHGFPGQPRELLTNDGVLISALD